ncbi:hypothetical protein DVH24_019335 [Malus domestica]|uniref:Uncharacterized protein n=1 Tax=Malus domestica TaxID=3750 RepID=A0A498I3E6_MALDO|nr:hypothetical protein DVH24_019335 [Malus domestica]
MIEMTHSTRRQGKPKPKPNQHLQSHSHGDCEVVKKKKMTEMTQSMRSSSKIKRLTSSSLEMKPRPKLVPSKSKSMSSVLFAVLGFLAWHLFMKIKVFDHRGYFAKLCIVFLPSLCAALVGISRVMITVSLAGRLRRRSCGNCHSFDLLLAVLSSPKPAGWVGTSSVFPHAGCIEECWRVLIFAHEVKLSSYAIC